MGMGNEDEDPSVTRFRDYIRIKSVHPNPDYEACITFVRKQAEEIGLEFHRLDFTPPAEFAVWLTWRGSDPSLKSLMLNSHMDVVPVDETKWKYDPFGAYKDADGNIYGRGTQDMKSVGMQYLESIRRLKKAGFVPRRTTHITFVPDEEIGGRKGMAVFVKSKEFQNLKVGFGLDEGGPSPVEQFALFNGERALWQISIKIRGNTGHALNFIENTAAEKSRRIINAFLDFREKEKAKLGTSLDLGNVTTVNMTMINGGVQPNVIPPEIDIIFDLRITPKWSQTEAEQFIQNVCKDAGEDIEVNYVLKGTVIEPTPVTTDSKWWTAFKLATDEIGITVVPMTCPGATDARFLREIGIPALGFSPMNNTPVLLHDNNEFVNERVYLKGIQIYENIVQRLAMLGGD